MKYQCILFTCILSVIQTGLCNTRFYRTYKCLEDGCQRTSKPIANINVEELLAKGEHASLAACNLVCGSTASLWPIPTGSFTTGTSYLAVHPSKFNFDLTDTVDAAKTFVSEATTVLMNNLEMSCNYNCSKASATIIVHIKVHSSSLSLNWDTDEAYSLHLTTKGTKVDESAESTVIVNIAATTVYGARHGLETLSQLTATVPSSNGGRRLVLLNSARIGDSPAFSHRGLLLDTARNFLPVVDILRTIDGLAATKMNVLHWHATDSQSFPIEIRSVPLMTRYGAYAPENIYSTERIGHVVKYGRSRGVRVILELDAPSHAGAGWEWGEESGLGQLAVCVGQQPWRQLCIQPPCGQLNPVNPNLYRVLRNIYKELLVIWGPEAVFHMGGDEVFFPCWNSTAEITRVMQERGLGRQLPDFLQLWAEFQASALRIIDEERSSSAGERSAILWSSHLTEPETIERYLNKTRYVIQTWVESDSKLNLQLLDLGYRLIISTKDAWYLDHGFWGNTKYHKWRDAYNNRIPRKTGVLGGEAAMWGEYVDGGSLDPRIWPRTAAVAERLWSDPPMQMTVADAEPRLQAHRHRLADRGIHSEAIAPEWCGQHQRECI